MAWGQGALARDVSGKGVPVAVGELAQAQEAGWRRRKAARHHTADLHAARAQAKMTYANK